MFHSHLRFEEGLEFLYPDLQAEYNWWGSGNPSFIAGRIWDQDDDENLIEVNFMNYYAKNDSLLEGTAKELVVIMVTISILRKN